MPVREKITACVECPYLELKKVLGGFFETSSGNGEQAAAQATVAAVAAALVAEKVDEGMSPHYIRSLRQYLAQFSKGRRHEPISAITTETVEEWFRLRQEAPATRASNLGRLSALFEHAVRRGFMAENPIRRIRPPRLRPSPPRILSPAEAGDLLARCRERTPDLLAYVTLGLFAGVRPMECLDLCWEDIDEETASVQLTRTKTGRRRRAHLEPAAVAWLSVCDHSLPLCPSWSTVRRRRRQLLPKWPPDLLRHSGASYLIELYGDAGKVALWLGNSARILLRHYHELVRPSDCRAFWAIRP